LLNEFQGTLLLVSHDRAFLDDIVTSTLVYEGDGRFNEYVGGYSDWLRQRRPQEAAKPAVKKRAAPQADRAKPVAKKLSYKDQRELDALPALIERLETEQAVLQEHMAEPGFYQQDGAAIADATQRLEQLGTELASAYERWEALEESSSA
jgi:ATP-binding cassette subfamily F protein uup